MRVGGGAGITRRTRPRERIHVKANGGARGNEERIARTWAEPCLLCYFKKTKKTLKLNLWVGGGGRERVLSSLLILHLVPLASEIQHSDLYIASHDLYFILLTAYQVSAHSCHFRARFKRRIVQQ